MTPVTVSSPSSIVSSSRRRPGPAEYALILHSRTVAIVALLFLGSQISDKLSIVGTLSLSRPPTCSDHGPSTTVRRAVPFLAPHQKAPGALGNLAVILHRA